MILCCGEALIDMLPDINKGGDPVLRPVTGGSIFNTAIALGRLQQPAGFLSGISKDAFGRLLIDDLEKAGVDHSLCIYSDRPTTLAVVDLSGVEANYTFYDEGSAGRMLEESEMPRIPTGTSTLMFGGISLIPEPCGGTYERLLINHAAKHLIYLDPNIRPNFIQDEALHRNRINRMIGYADIIKVSVDDLKWMEPELDETQAINKWLKCNPSIILLSRGGEGAEAHTVDGVVSAPAECVIVVDTIGAGDTFSAGFLASLNEQVGLTKDAISCLTEPVLQSTLIYANKAAAVTASRKGANPPMLTDLQDATALRVN